MRCIALYNIHTGDWRNLPQTCVSELDSLLLIGSCFHELLRGRWFNFVGAVPFGNSHELTQSVTMQWSVSMYLYVHVGTNSAETWLCYCKLRTMYLCLKYSSNSQPLKKFWAKLICGRYCYFKKYLLIEDGKYTKYDFLGLGPPCDLNFSISCQIYFLVIIMFIVCLQEV